MFLFTFGDSITWGASDEMGGWSDRLKRSFEKSVVFNMGIPGNDSTQGLARFVLETTPRIVPGEQHIFLFAFGANDAAVHTDTNQFRVAPDVFTSNITTMISQAKHWSPHVFLLTITPVLESITRARTDKLRTNAFIDQYNQLIKDIATKEQVHLIDINQAFTQNSPKNLLSKDGVHPNTNGHALMFQIVNQALQRANI